MTTTTFTAFQTARDMTWLRDPQTAPSPPAHPLKADLAAHNRRMRQWLQSTYRVMKLWYL